MGSITIHTKLLFSASDFSAQFFFRHLECHFTAIPNHFLCSSSFSFIPVNEIILKYEEDINYIAALILLMLREESCPIGFWDSDITILKIRATLDTVQIFLFSFDYCFIRLPSLLRKSKLGKLSVVLISSYYLILTPCQKPKYLTASPSQSLFFKGQTWLLTTTMCGVFLHDVVRGLLWN